MEKIILASSSPRRKELLELIGLSFTIHPSNAEEVYDEKLTPSQVVEALSLLKANDVVSHYKEGIVIGSDTIVVLDEKILGKPKNKEEAFLMLKRLQGRKHQVLSGVAVVHAKTGISLVRHHETIVYMKALTDDEIHAYIDTNEPMDKAGSYGIQGIGAILIEKIEGDYFNVVGLPISLLAELLEIFDIHLLKEIIRPKK